MKKIVKKTVVQTAVLMVLFTLVAKVLGFIRELVMACYFGTGYITDAYIMAQTIPTVLFGGIFVALGTAYMPLLADVTEHKGKEQGDLFTSQLINCLLIISILVSILGIIFSQQLVNVFAKGFESQSANLATYYVRITFLYIFFTATAAIFETYLQYKGIFLTQIIAGYIQNTIVIILIVISAYSNYHYLVLGLLIGNAIRALIIIIKAKKTSFKYYKSLQMVDTINKIGGFAVPVFIGTYIQQINTFVDKSLGSTLPEGSVSALYYAMLIITLITGLSASVVSTIIYPKMAQAASKNDYKKLEKITQKGIDLICIITIPFAIGIIVYGKQVVQIIYERGAFDQSSTLFTGTAFIFYGFGLVSLALNELLVRILYSIKDIKTPMFFGGISVIINIVFDLLLIGTMRHNGLALATSIAFISYTCLLILGIHKNSNNIILFSDKTKILKIFISAVFAVLISFIIYNSAIMVVPERKDIMFFILMGSVLTAVVVYLFSLKLCKIEEFEMIKNVFYR